MRKTEHLILLVWLFTIGLVTFGFVVIINTGLLWAMVETDRSRICMVIIALYLVGVGHSLARTLYLSRQLNSAALTERMLRMLPRQDPVYVDGRRLVCANGPVIPDSFVTAYIMDIITARSARNGNDAAIGVAHGDILEANASRLRSAHEFGWFLIDLTLKVGFLGTLVGFILMLASVSQNEILDASMMQRVLRQMSYGMSTALNTTLVSLVAGILLSIPYYLLGRGLDELLETTVNLTETEVLPRLS